MSSITSSMHTPVPLSQTTTLCFSARMLLLTVTVSCFARLVSELHELVLLGVVEPQGNAASARDHSSVSP